MAVFDALKRFVKNIRFLGRVCVVEQAQRDDIFATPLRAAELLARARERATARAHGGHDRTECGWCRRLAEVEIIRPGMPYTTATSVILWATLIGVLVPSVFWQVVVLGAILTCIGGIGADIFDAENNTNVVVVRAVTTVPLLIIVPALTILHRVIAHPLYAIARAWRRFKRGTTCARCVRWKPIAHLKELLGWSVAGAVGIAITTLIIKTHPDGSKLPEWISVVALCAFLVATAGGLIGIAPLLIGCFFRSCRRLFHRHAVSAAVPASIAAAPGEQQLVAEYLRYEIERERAVWVGDYSPCSRARVILALEHNRVVDLLAIGQRKLDAAKDRGEEPRMVVTATVEQLTMRRDEYEERFRKIAAYLAAAGAEFDTALAYVDRIIEPMEDRDYARAAAPLLGRADEILAMADRVIEEQTEALCLRMAHIRASLTTVLQDAEFDTALAAATSDAHEITALENAADRLRVPEQSAAQSQRAMPTAQLVSH
ncbi:MAG: hypothetical protein Q7S96_01690 [bacterium]|nr:hypothetical protein [bacterium]